MTKNYVTDFKSFAFCFIFSYCCCCSAAPTAAMIFGGKSAFGSTTATSTTPSALSMFGKPAPPAVSTSKSALLPTPVTSAPADSTADSTTTQTTNLFSSKPDTTQGLFGKPADAPKTAGLFGTAPAAGTGLFGQPSKPALTAQGVFGSAAATPQNVFGAAPKFGASATPQSVFGTPKAEPAKSLFGMPDSTASSKPSLFGKSAEGASSDSKEGDGSLLRKLLTDEAAKPATSKPTEKVTMGGFTFTG